MKQEPPPPSSSRAPGLVPPTPEAAAAVFGDRLPLAERFVQHLATTGISWGLIGPREAGRLWARHVLNCAVLTELLPASCEVMDIGSGAGLPGLPLAIRQPDVCVVLLEPLLRRATWLGEVVNDLGLANVRVERTRAEELHGAQQAQFVTARAVAPLDRLARWGLPLLSPGGQLLAMKGRSAADEVAQTAGAVQEAGGRPAQILIIGAKLLDEPVTVVRVELARQSAGSVASSRARSAARPAQTSRPRGRRRPAR